MLIKNITLHSNEKGQKAVAYAEEVESCHFNLTELCKGLLNSDKSCTTCKKINIPQDCNLSCGNCQKLFHITCMNDPVAYDIARTIREKPCVWWICYCCLQTQKMVNDETGSHLNKLIDTRIHSILGNFKEELFAGIDSRMGPCPTQVPPSLPTSSTSSTLIAGTKRKADDVITAAAKVRRRHNSASPLVSSPLAEVTGSVNNLVESVRNGPTRNAPPPPLVDVPVRNEKFILHYRPVSNELILKDEEWLDLRKSISSKLSRTKVLFSHFNKKTGKVVVGFPSKQSKDVAADLLKDVVGLRCYELYVPEKMLPKLTLHNVPLDFDLVDTESSGHVQRDLVKDEIWQTIMDKNDGVKSLVESGSVLEIVYFRKHKYSATVAIKVSPELRLFILEKLKSKIFLFSNCCKASDRCHYQQCYHCLKYGHIAKDCPKASESPICMYCADTHDSRTCSKRKSTADYRCYNCISSNPPSTNFNHCACSPNCPSALAIANRIQLNTQLVANANSQSKNN